jgi:hypothetical protein
MATAVAAVAPVGGGGRGRNNDDDDEEEEEDATCRLAVIPQPTQRGPTGRGPPGVLCGSTNFGVDINLKHTVAVVLARRPLGRLENTSSYHPSALRASVIISTRSYLLLLLFFPPPSVHTAYIAQ